MSAGLRIAVRPEDAERRRRAEGVHEIGLGGADFRHDLGNSAAVLIDVAQGVAGGYATLVEVGSKAVFDVGFAAPYDQIDVVRVGVLSGRDTCRSGQQCRCQRDCRAQRLHAATGLPPRRMPSTK